MKEDINKFFPESISFPDELGMLSDWFAQNGYPISGDFELRAGDGEDFYWWFRSHAADDRLALFGAGPDGSLVCIWRQDDGRQPIVHLGSEGDGLKILSGNMREFIILLAIGYSEIGHDDLALPPNEQDCINPEFQNWVKETFSAIIPETGQNIQSAAQESHEDFEAWVTSVPNDDENG